MTSKKNRELWNIFKNTGCLLSKGAVIQLYKKRFKSVFFISFTSGNSMWFSASNWQVNERTEGCVQIWQFQKRYLRFWCISVIYFLCTYLYMYIVHVLWKLRIYVRWNFSKVNLYITSPWYNKWFSLPQ